MKAFIRACVDHPTTINVFMFALLAVGLASTLSIQRESFPKVTLDLIQARVVWPGHTPKEVEEAIVVKIEEAINGTEGIDSINSVAASGLGVVTVELAKGVDIDKAFEDIRNAVMEIPNFPADIEPPVVRSLTNRSEAIGVVIHGPVQPAELRKLAEQLRDDLVDLGAVSQVGIEGMPERQLAIEVSPARLMELGITLDTVMQAVRRSNVEISTGTLRTPQEDLLIKAGVKGYTAQELRAIPVITGDSGAELTLGQVASVVEKESEELTRMRFDGRPAALVQVSKTDGEDVLEVVAAVKAYVEGADGRFPAGIELALWRDRTSILHQRIDLLSKNGFVGLVLIFLALWLFTRLKLSLWVAAGLPVAVLGSAILIGAVGVTINMISLFGLLLVSGILVDDAIVVAENVYAHIEMGKSPREAAVIGTAEVFPAVSASIVTTIIAFIPFFFMGGRIGKFVQAIPIVVICCLILSFIESLIILPSHLAHSLKPVSERRNTLMNRLRVRVDATVDRFMRVPYSALLRIILRFRWQTVVVGIGLLMLTGAYMGSGLIKIIFFPNLDSDSVEARYVLEPGAPEAVNEAFARRIERAAVATDAELTAEQTGGKTVMPHTLTELGGSGGSEAGRIVIELLPGEERDANANAIGKRWNKALGSTPEARTLTVGPRRRGPFGKPVEVQLLSGNAHDLELAAEQLKDIIRGYPGTYDVSDDLALGKREIVLELTPRGRALGFTLAHLASQLRTGLFGGRAEVIQRGRDELEVWVRFPKEHRDAFGGLTDLRVRNSTGDEIPLGEVATWTTGRSLSRIDRFDRRRKVTVSAAVDASVGDPNKILASIRDDEVPKLLAGFADMKASFEGQERSRRKMIEGFKSALPWAGVGMLAVLIIVFGSIAQGFLVMLIIPLGLVGAVAGHVIIGIPLTVLSSWGIVALGGILVNDSIVFVDAINRRLRRGELLLDAIHAAGTSRLRPIILTTLTTAAGLMPLILEQSRQAQFLIPMAVSLAFGLIVGTIFTLGVLPAGFACINDVRCFISWLRTGRWPHREQLEPSVKRHNAK
ncbi:MAG: multidrug efflux pump subunit AcrB [Myxococcota bacterium]